MKLEDLYSSTWSLGNQDHLPCGELPEEYKGDPYMKYSNFEREEYFYDDSNFFDDPFEDEERSFNPIRRSKSHEILGVDEDADETEIKQAFRDRARETHPDKIGGDGEEFKKVREAYELLIGCLFR
jgi:hypothetical protein